MASTTVGPTCPICGSRSIASTGEPVTVELRTGSYTVSGFEYERCTACGEEFHPAGQTDAIRSAASKVAREEACLLLPDEIRELRMSLGLTQGDLERLLGVGEKTVGRWERGLFVQSKTADTLMRLLQAHPELIEETGFVAREGRGPYRKQVR